MGAVASSIRAFTYDLVASLYRKFTLKDSTASNFRKAEMVYRILVASYTDAIYTLSFDPSKPPDKALSLSYTLTVGHHPSWIECKYDDPTVIFTGLEQADGRILALMYNLYTGEGHILANDPSGGADPCSILATETNIFVANYSSGTIGIYERLSLMSPITFKETQPPLILSGSGPDPERQGTSHPHQVYFSKRDTSASLGPTDELLVPDLGSDKVWRLAKNVENSWKVKDKISFNKHAGGGPRHVVVYDSKLYTLLELTNKISVHDFRTNGTKPSLVAEVSLPMPEGRSLPKMLAAEILCPAPNSQFPTAYLYVSNRNDPRPHGDLISIFATHKDGRSDLEHIGDVSTGLAHVRGFTFFGPDDRFVIVGGANGGGVKVFERIDGGRSLHEVAHLPASDGGVGLAPTAFLCLRPVSH